MSAQILVHLRQFRLITEEDTNVRWVRLVPERLEKLRADGSCRTCDQDVLSVEGLAVTQVICVLLLLRTSVHLALNLRCGLHEFFDTGHEFSE